MRHDESQLILETRYRFVLVRLQKKLLRLKRMLLQQHLKIGSEVSLLISGRVLIDCCCDLPRCAHVWSRQNCFPSLIVLIASVVFIISEGSLRSAFFFKKNAARSRIVQTEEELIHLNLWK